jgi:hypothetical protein
LTNFPSDKQTQESLESDFPRKWIPINKHGLNEKSN